MDAAPRQSTWKARGRQQRAKGAQGIASMGPVGSTFPFAITITITFPSTFPFAITVAITITFPSTFPFAITVAIT
ncbi:MAG: hypothetical protein ACOCV2_13635, partial [Persicimonas sp.]